MKHLFARQLRRAQTDAERKLWSALRSRQFAGFKFRRQQPVGPYIADFACFEARLIIELDGDQHGTDQGSAYDRARTRFLERDGFQVLRFPNRDIFLDFDRVQDVIAHSLSRRPLTRRIPAECDTLSHRGRG
ncbi:MAG: endonuclease domain-containing protein [Alphaproteobacteria bacterium]